MQKIAVILAAVLIGCSPYQAIDLPAESPLQDRGVEPYVYIDPLRAAMEAETGIPHEIVMRLMISESSLRPIGLHPAINYDGSRDRGFSGVSGRYHDYFAVEFMGGSFNPEAFSESYIFSARYLARLYGALGCKPTAVLAYKMGAGRIDLAGPRMWSIARWVVGGM